MLTKKDLLSGFHIHQLGSFFILGESAVRPKGKVTWEPVYADNAKTSMRCRSIDELYLLYSAYSDPRYENYFLYIMTYPLRGDVQLLYFEYFKDLLKDEFKRFKKLLENQ